VGQKQIELNRKQLEETLTYLGYKIYDEHGAITDRAFDVIKRLLDQHVVESVMLPTFIAEEWAKSLWTYSAQKVRFSNIVWDTDGKFVELPSEVTLEVPKDKDVDLEGADVLSDKYGWCVKGFEFEVVK
jgi:hypothetical protein